ncbi:MFS transporter [Corynebacterium comes]|uniref:Inner membrane transport protein YdhP n=1 Tax=Corynebacterium comes TaxID=2675218 RepID=A0A6B8WAE1_9CORY|nr:MFS transporter [Corynebacterium comes]QGU03858.1 Inner membrane transport protein YdhP [Corynebacterium comes]
MVALALGGFAIGTTEFVSMGLLPLIADDFRIAEDQAGHIISAYALGVVVGAPVITALTGVVPRRRLLLLLMVAFTVGHVIAALADNYPLLLAARFLAGLPHGAYFSVAGLSAASMAPRGQRGRAIAFVGMGLSVATVAGVPAAQALGQAFGWPAAYVLVAVLGLATFLALWVLMPHMTKMAPTSALTELGALSRAQVWLTLAIGTVGFGGMFAVYTYISWTMTEQAGIDLGWMWLVLMAYGVGSVLGNWFGGRLADRNLEYGILLALVMIAVVLTAFYFSSANPVVGTLNFALIGFFGASLVPSLQIRLMDVAGESQTLAAALNHSALNLANAGGAALGGVVIAAGLGYSAPALAGAGLAVAAILIWFPAVWLRRRSTIRYRA